MDDPEAFDSEEEIHQLEEELQQQDLRLQRKMQHQFGDLLRMVFGLASSWHRTSRGRIPCTGRRTCTTFRLSRVHRPSKPGAILR